MKGTIEFTSLEQLKANVDILIQLNDFYLKKMQLAVESKGIPATIASDSILIDMKDLPESMTIQDLLDGDLKQEREAMLELLGVKVSS